MFTLPDVEIIEKFWSVDGNAVFANIGGYLGLLLGTSCLYLVEISLNYCSKIISRQSKQKNFLADF